MNYCSKCGKELEIKVIDSIERNMCSGNECDFVNWNNPTPVVAAVVKFNGKYVLARNSAWKEGVFSMITGFIECNELPKKSIIREVEEELGLFSENVKFIGHFSFKKMNQLIIAYHIEAKGVIELSSELSEVKCITESDLIGYDFGEFGLTRDIVNSCFQPSKM